MKTVVVYHHPCLDGYASLLAAQHHLKDQKDVTYIEGEYHKDIDPLLFSGAIVYLVDFSYKREVVKQICNLAFSVTILDHHESAEEDLFQLELEHANLHMFYHIAKKQEMSGVGITWWYFSRKADRAPLPKVFERIQDRDLWRHKEGDGTAEICVTLDSFNWNYDKWNEAVFHNNNDLTTLLSVGESLIAYANMLRDHIAKTVVYEDLFGYEDVPVLVNCPKPLFSELARRFFTDEVPITVNRMWDSEEECWVWSIRTHDDHPIVLDLVSPYGGGGHANAGGFKSTTEDPDFCQEHIDAEHH